MSYAELDLESWKRAIRRVLIIGGPNTLKTTAIIRTFPKPLHILSYPGEKGVGVIPANDPMIKGHVWTEDDPSKVSVHAQIREIEQTTWNILAGKRGEIKTFAGDGLAKLASLYWNREYQRLLLVHETQIMQNKMDRDGIPLSEALKLRAYGNENFGACREIMAYVSAVNQSNVDTVVFTCWEGIETEDKELAGNAQRHIFADLPGRLARRIVGEFAVVLYSEVSLPDPKGNISGSWQIRRAGKVWGVGIKVPYAIATTLPDRVAMNWEKLYSLLLGGDVK